MWPDPKFIINKYDKFKSDVYFVSETVFFYLDFTGTYRDSESNDTELKRSGDA